MKKEIAEIIKNAILSLQKEKIFEVFVMSEIIVDYAKVEKFGDYSTNIAMNLAKVLKKNPMENTFKGKNFIVEPPIHFIQFFGLNTFWNMHTACSIKFYKIFG